MPWFWRSLWRRKKLMNSMYLSFGKERSEGDEQVALRIEDF
jgi:hypothetical protein